ncbi:hypothetical protein NEMIN01_1986 [Nematocida minor]|uniref:uncharacterized protein n=1 Tax=Nematocida minor TaxID=1912983 RepID=UPI00221EDBFE|nr:uncharacterized protein NEMIN01_1986 [Nematocida minor]KAI5192372.1 hypothetical protein NEMIN01_1986 [Nematocida minor]
MILTKRTVGVKLMHALFILVLCALLKEAAASTVSEGSIDADGMADLGTESAIKWLKEYISQKEVCDSISLSPDGLLSLMYEEEVNNIVKVVVCICFGPENLQISDNWEKVKLALVELIERTNNGADVINAKSTALYNAIVNHPSRVPYSEEVLVDSLRRLFGISSEESELKRQFLSVKSLHSGEKKENSGYTLNHPVDVLNMLYLHAVLYGIDIMENKLLSWNLTINTFLYNLGKEVDRLMRDAYNSPNEYIHRMHISDYLRLVRPEANNYCKVINNILNTDQHCYTLEHIQKPRETYNAEFNNIKRVSTGFYRMTPATYIHPFTRFTIRNNITIKKSESYRDDDIYFLNDCWYLDLTHDYPSVKKELQRPHTLKDVIIPEHIENIVINSDNISPEERVEIVVRCFGRNNYNIYTRDAYSGAINRSSEKKAVDTKTEQKETITGQTVCVSNLQCA